MQKKHFLSLQNIIIICVISFQFAIIFNLIYSKYVSLVDNSGVGMDFLSYYSVGYIFREVSATNIYNLPLQYQTQGSLMPNYHGVFTFFNHPPILVPLLGWTVEKDFTIAYTKWVVIIILFQIISLGILIKLMYLQKWERRKIWLTALSGVFFYPFIVACMRGHDSTFLFLGISIWAFGLITSKDIVAGLGLAMVMIRPQIALVLAVPFLFKNRRVWFWFMLWGFALFIYMYLSVGLKGIIGFVEVMQHTGSGLGLDVNNMATFMGFVIRWFPGITPYLFKLIGYFGYLISILFLCMVWIKSDIIGFKQINIAILCAILFSPHLNYHDLIILFVPIIGVISLLNQSKALGKYAIFLPLVISVLLIIGDLLNYLFFIYLIIFSLAILSWKPVIFDRFQRIVKV